MNYTVEVTDSGDFISGTGSKAPRTSTTPVSTFTAPVAIADNAISKLVEWSPASSNLFEVSIEGMKETSVLHCTSVRFSGARLEFTRSNTTKLFMMDMYQPSDEVTINWREDANHSVRLFHEKWAASFYDRDNDHYISSTSGENPLGNKLRSAIVTIQKMTSSGLVAVAELHLVNMIPSQIPDLELDWASESAIDYQLSYKVESWYWVKK